MKKYKINISIFLSAIALLIIGYTTLSGSDNIFSSTKIVLAPILILSGYFALLFAILIKPKTIA